MSGSPRTLANCFPVGVQRELVRFCLAEDESTAAGAWRRFAEAADLDALDAGSARLLPLAADRLARWRIEHPEAARVKGTQRHAWAANQTTVRRLAVVLAAFREAGVPALLLKGLPLAFTVYPNPGARPMDDVDVLVPPERAREAIAVLERLGAEAVSAKPGEPRAGRPDPLGFMHGTAFCVGGALNVDLHWHALEECCHAGADDGYRERKERLVVAGLGEAWQLGPGDAFLHLCVHGLRANPVPSIRWIVDAALLVRARRDIDWPQVAAEAVRRRVVVPLRHAIDYLAEEQRAPVPEVVRAMMAAQPAGWLERVAHRGNVRATVATQFAATWLRYRRATQGVPLARAVAGFPRFLESAWDKPGLWAVACHVAARMTGGGLRRRGPEWPGA